MGRYPLDKETVVELLADCTDLKEKDATIKLCPDEIELRQTNGISIKMPIESWSLEEGKTAELVGENKKYLIRITVYEMRTIVNIISKSDKSPVNLFAQAEFRNEIIDRLLLTGTLESLKAIYAIL